MGTQVVKTVRSRDITTTIRKRKQSGVPHKDNSGSSLWRQTTLVGRRGVIFFKMQIVKFLMYQNSTISDDILQPFTN